MNTRFLTLILTTSCALTLISCGGDKVDEESTQSEGTTIIELPFEEGGAQTAEEFFSGVNQQVEAADLWLSKVQDYDLIDASEDSIKGALDSMMMKVDEGISTLKLYEENTWNNQAAFNEITLNWYNALADLANNYFYKMAEPMSRPDNSWNTEEQAFYDEYVSAYNNFFEIDKQWLIQKDEFAAANNFKVESEVTDLL